MRGLCPRAPPSGGNPACGPGAHKRKGARRTHRPIPARFPRSQLTALVPSGDRETSGIMGSKSTLLRWPHMTGNGLARVKITKQTQFVDSSGPAWLRAGIYLLRKAKINVGSYVDLTPIPPFLRQGGRGVVPLHVFYRFSQKARARLPKAPSPQPGGLFGAAAFRRPAPEFPSRLPAL